MDHFKTLQEIIDLLGELGHPVCDVEVKEVMPGAHVFILKTDAGEWPIARDWTGQLYFNVFDFLTYAEMIRRKRGRRHGK